MRLFHRENQLPGIGLVTNTNQLLDQLQIHFTEADVPDLTISDIRYKPGTSCLVAFRSVSRSTGLHEFVHAKAFTQRHWPAVRKKLGEADHGILLLDDRAVAVFRFPFDRELPSLRKWVNSPQRILSRSLYNSQHTSELESWHILSYKPHRRMTLKVELQQGNPVVLKFHDEDSFPKVLGSQRMARRARAVRPARIGRSNRHRTLANQWVAGETLQLINRVPRDVEELFTMVLDHLSEINRTLDSMSLWSAPVYRLGELCKYLKLLFPPVTPVFQRVLRQIAELDTPRDQPVFCHGDFHERQLVVNDSGIRAIDFDKGCAGDATTDAANFVAHLICQSCVNGAGMGVSSLIRQLAQKRFRDRSSHDLTLFRVNCLKALAQLVTTPFRSGHQCWMTQTENVLGQLELLASEAMRTRSFPESGNPKDRESTTWKKQMPVNPVTRSGSPVLIDPRLPCLEALQDLEEAESVLRIEVPELTERLGEFSLHSVMPLRYKPGRRCLIKYCLRGIRGSTEVLGKASAKSNYRKASRIQSQLYHDLGFDSSSVDQISVPRVLGICDRWRMWFQESVPAKSAGHLLTTHGHIDGTILAGAFTKLHQCGLVVRRKHSVGDELSILVRRLSEHTGSTGSLAGRICSVVKSCRRVANNLPACAQRCIHRDLYQDQVLISRHRIWLVDLDTIAMGHPAIDVGNFVAHLIEHGIRCCGNPEHWKRLSTQLTATYQQLNPDITPGAIDAFTTISLARHIAISCQFPERRMHMPAILQEVERRLGNRRE